MALPARDLDALRQIAQLAAPVTLAREHTMPVLDELAPILPQGGLRRGSSVGVSGPGATSLALALSVEVSAGGAWVVAIGLPTLGLTAAAELGVGLERWAFVDEPGDDASEVLSALVGAVDLVLLGPSVTMRIGHTRKLSARMRERGTSVVHVRPRTHGTLQNDLTLDIESSRWVGVEQGHGRLQARRVEIVTGGRGAAVRPRRAALWLPGPDGRVSVIEQLGDRGGSSDRDGASKVQRWERTAPVVELARRVG